MDNLTLPTGQTPPTLNAADENIMGIPPEKPRGNKTALCIFNRCNPNGGSCSLWIPRSQLYQEAAYHSYHNWQIYQNEKYGLEFKYPTEARLFLGADCLGCSDEELEAVNSARVIIDYSGGIIFQVQILEYNKTQPQFVKIGKNAEQTAELWRKYNKEGENNPNVFTYVSRIVEQNTNGLGGYSYTVSGSINFPWEMGLLSYPMRFNFFDFPARPETIIVISLSIREENLNDVSNQIISTFKFFEPTEK